jgi:WD40 repeat protein
VALYSAEAGTTLAVWPVAGEAVRGLAFSPDGKYLAAGGGVPGDSGNVIIFNTETGKPACTVSGHHDTVEAVAFASPSLLLSAANDEKVRISDPTTGQTVGVLGEHVGRCLSVALPAPASEADGSDIFVTGGADNVVKVWDAKSRRVVVNFDQCQGPVWSIAPLPRASGRFVVACADGRLRIFGVRADSDGKTGEGARTGFLARNVAAHEGGVYAVAASPDGKWIASGGADKKVVVWNGDLNRAREMTEAAGDVFAVAISPDSRLVAAGSMDGKTRVYTLADGKLVWELPGAPAAVNGPALRSTAR